MIYNRRQNYEKIYKYCYGCKKAEEPIYPRQIQTVAKDECLNEIVERGVLKVGIVLDSQQPMSFMNSDYNIIGFDIDLGKKICDYINANYGGENTVKIQFNPVSEEKKAQALENGDADIILDRCVSGADENMSYSKGYIKDKPVIVSYGEYGDTEALKDASVGVLNKGGALADKGVNMVSSYTSVDELMAALSEKRVDAVVVSELAYLNFIKDSDSDTGLKVKDAGLGESVYSAAVRKDANSVSNAVNEAFDSFNTDGTMNELAQKWFAKTDCLVK